MELKIKTSKYILRIDWSLVEVGMHEGDQKVQTSSYTINNS